MKLYYIWDAYCGWCFGFKEALKPFVANHPEIDLEILSGGLFDQGNPLSAYPHIPGANKQIAQLFHVEFGPAYEELLRDGKLILNSYHAASGFGTLKAFLPKEKWLDAAEKLQMAFYHDGKSFSEIETYEEIASEFSIQNSTFSKSLQEALGSDNGIHADYELVRSFGVSSYPTLILEKDGKFYDLRAGAMTADELENNFKTISALA